MNKPNSIKEVNIKIKTTQNDETTEWESIGDLYTQDKKYIVTYPDYTGNTATENKLTISKDSMQVIREGAIKSIMLFIESVITSGKYSLMLYDMDIEVYTTDYNFSDTDDMLNVCADYQLFDSGNLLAENTIQITIDKN